MTFAARANAAASTLAAASAIVAASTHPAAASATVAEDAEWVQTEEGLKLKAAVLNGRRGLPLAVVDVRDS